jgi:uncharacterized membrane protein YfcA
MGPHLLAALLVVAVLSAAISAITGVAGGIVLLSVLLFALDPRAVVPVHGAVQLVANSSRLVVFWRHVQWGVVARFAAMVVPGAIAGASLVALLSPRVMQIAIACAILLSLAAPRSKTQAPPSRRRWFYPLGFLCGGLGMIVGSTGPIVTQALLWSGVLKEAHIATKAACQALANIIKLTLYGTTLGFAFGEHAPVIALLSVGVVLGTFIGKRVLRQVSDRTFVLATRVLLVLVAVKSLVFA